LTGSGTDANVFIKIFGDKLETEIIPLRNGYIHEKDIVKKGLDMLNKELSNNKGLFENGKTDVIKIKGSNVGEIKKINISHDGKGIGDGWFLETVKITVNDKTYEYVLINITSREFLFLNNIFILVSNALDGSMLTKMMEKLKLICYH
jgi:hypothetical protein